MGKSDDERLLLCDLSWDARFQVEVIGRSRPDVAPRHDSSDHDWLEVDFVVSGSFVAGRSEETLIPDDLDEWADLIDAVEAGRPAWWRETGRCTSLLMTPVHDGRMAELQIFDAVRTGMSVMVPVNLAEGWADELRARLAEVRAAFPRRSEEM